VSAAGVFVATNVDDLVVLAAFFADRARRPASIVVGQLVGMAVLVSASVAVAMASVVVPGRWVALLGLVPLALGIHSAVALVRRRDTGAGEDGTPARSRSDVLAVAGVTIANGSDNLAVYIPIFAANRRAVAIDVAVFALLTLVWCGLGYALVRNPLLGRRASRYGRAALPVVLIAVGFKVLFDLLCRG
jgi:cadmium resistance protein CadD (predicted permease)